jgi:hypothetical protein
MFLCLEEELQVHVLQYVPNIAVARAACRTIRDVSLRARLRRCWQVSEKKYRGSPLDPTDKLNRILTSLYFEASRYRLVQISLCGISPKFFNSPDDSPDQALNRIKI